MRRVNLVVWLSMAIASLAAAQPLTVTGIGRFSFSAPSSTASELSGISYVSGNTYYAISDNDSKLYALDSATGKLIFSKELPNGSQGVPAVYQVNGREYILLAVSGGGTPYPEGAYLPPGGKMNPTDWKGYMAFALPASEGAH